MVGITSFIIVHLDLEDNMGNIVTKLNLNSTPNLVENNSLVFAKNIRIDIDGTIHKDYSINPISIVPTSNHDIFYDNILTRIIADFTSIINNPNSPNTSCQSQSCSCH